jgi:hypothetical protein
MCHIPLPHLDQVVVVSGKLAHAEGVFLAGAVGAAMLCNPIHELVIDIGDDGGTGRSNNNATGNGEAHSKKDYILLII